MKLEISLTEAEKLINEYYKLNLSLKNTEKNKIQVTNIDSVVLVYQKISDNIVSFSYEVSGLVDLIAKVARFFLHKKLKTIPLKWSAKEKEISLDLKEIDEVNTMLHHVSINDIIILNDAILFDFNFTEEFKKEMIKA